MSKTTERRQRLLKKCTVNRSIILTEPSSPSAADVKAVMDGDVEKIQ